MKIKIVDIISDYGSELEDSFCETCEWLNTWDITRVEIQEVGTDNVETVKFDNMNESIIEDWKFQDWVKFNDWLNETVFETYEPVADTFNKAIRYWKESYYGK